MLEWFNKAADICATLLFDWETVVDWFFQGGKK